MAIWQSVWLVAALGLASAGLTHADSAPMWESPVGLAPGGSTAIQLTAEDVHVDIQERGSAPVAVVDATFDLLNPRASTELLVGFPSAAYTVLPVLGVPVQSAALQGLDSLLSIVQMPGGVPVGTLAIGKAGATNAGILAVSILANSRPDLRARLRDFRAEQTERVRQERLP